MHNDSTNKKNFAVFIYLVIAFGITWLGWIPGLVSSVREGYIMPNFTSYQELFESGFQDSRHLWLGIGFQLGVFGPLIGALVATALESGREGLADLWQRMIKWRIDSRWYLRAVGLTALISGLPVLVFALLGNFSSSPYTIGYILLVLVVQFFTSGLGEEPGWRGFLLPRLKTRFAGENYVWMLGLIWAVWHYPLGVQGAILAAQNTNTIQLIITIVSSLAGMTMAQIGIAFIYAWMYNNTESVFLMIVFHAFSNVFNLWFSSFLAVPSAATIIIALMPWAVVVYLQKKLGRENFPG